MVEEVISYIIELLTPIPSSGGRKGAPDTVRKATRYAKWYKQENPNRSPSVDRFLDAIIETRERQAGGGQINHDTEHLLDAAFKELDRHAASGTVSPLAEELVASALVHLDRDVEESQAK